ncbi:hypothetical protein HCB45_03510 [Listeria sp. FSL L7-0091]|uniref:Uncharacterized protein n=1 Tax=Listeria farberi TaxID=2713500 RepID=A0A7X0ZGR2_9LIST|nr:hypothetical protein [Listeria farberi]MBC1374014.1 hypothetical protein [Listeria farberi]MBC1381334.1 hypothetical protein [Listeria farberi]MBC2260657.1 hypothetical protein [Listeria farberi]MBC2267543.1 hypothetical protein [Listeria farberi]MBC2287004.1 hypothetical protein [Listeria farberi]
MDKKEFLQELEEIVSDPIFIGKNKSERQKEIDNNMWCISINVKVVEGITLEDLLIFIKRVISNRNEQVQKLKLSKTILFYLWFDAQASQIRFNVISNYDIALPFGCKTTFVDNYDCIIKEFLQTAYHNDCSYIDEYTSQDFSLKVYLTKL